MAIKVIVAHCVNGMNKARRCNVEQPEARIKVGDLRRILRASDTMLKVMQALYADDVVKVKVKRGGRVQLSVQSTGEIKEFSI